MRTRMLIGALVALVLGCSTVEPAGVETSALSGSVGVLHVERTALADAALDEGATLEAAFARYSGIDGESVLDLLGSGGAPELGRCLVSSPDAMDAVELGADGAEVELVDVGALRVSVADTETELTPRTFPDLASVLAGVFYAEVLGPGEATLSVPEPEVDAYRFVAEGSLDVGAFEVDVPAPAAPSGVALLGADGTGGRLDARVTDVGATDDLILLWDAGDPQDLIEIELVAATETLSCTSADEGSFRIAAADLALLGSDPEARLVVRRVRVVGFDALGMDASFARVAASRTFPLSVR